MNGRSNWFTIVALVITSSCLGQTTERLNNGLEFKLPAGWQIKAGPDGALIMPPDIVWAGQDDPAEMYIVAILAGVKDVTDPQLTALLQTKFFANSRLQSGGPPRSFTAGNGKGIVYDFNAMENGVPLRVQLYVAGLPGGGVATLIAGGKKGLIEKREATLTGIAATLTSRSGTTFRPAGNGPLAREWDTRFRGKKLVQLRGYNSGGGAGGYNGRKTLILAADGTYSYQSSMAIAVYTDGNSGTSTSRQSHSGNWRVYEQGGRVLLELRSTAGDVTASNLAYEGGKTFLDGERWFVVGINE